MGSRKPSHLTTKPRPADLLRLRQAPSTGSLLEAAATAAIERRRAPGEWRFHAAARWRAPKTGWRHWRRQSAAEAPPRRRGPTDWDENLPAASPDNPAT